MDRRIIKSRNRMMRAFTLVELLVVIGIIAVLIAMLFPMLKRARTQAMQTVCLSNLRQIYAGARLYANDYKDHFPDPQTIGNDSYRQAPGHLTTGDHSARPEVYGLQAILHGIGYGDDLSRGIIGKGRYLSAASAVWVCPAEPQTMQEYGNTYFISINKLVGTDTSVHRGRPTAVATPWVFDNWAYYPALTGFRGPFAYVVPPGLRFVPHVLRINALSTRGANELFLDGHTDLIKVQQ